MTHIHSHHVSVEFAEGLSVSCSLRRCRWDAVTTHVARNERGRFRIARIDVELSPTFAALMGSGQRRCEELFEDFCTAKTAA
jgi:hypothetical protein